MENQPAKRSNGPGFGTVLGLVLGLAALGLELGDVTDDTAALVMYIVAGVVLVGSLVWGGRCSGGWFQPSVAAWSGGSSRISRARPRRNSGSASRTHGPERSAGGVDRERADMRAALNEISEELEYVQQKIRENDGQYWEDFKLPAAEWHEHGSTVAS